MSSKIEVLPGNSEPRPDAQALTGNPDPSKNSSTGVDYEPHPEHSVPLSKEKQHIVDCICNLYSGSASKQDMEVYSDEETVIYNDPYSYCDTRYKIAGQWYGKSVDILVVSWWLC